VGDFVVVKTTIPIIDNKLAQTTFYMVYKMD